MNHHSLKLVAISCTLLFYGCSGTPKLSPLASTDYKILDAHTDARAFVYGGATMLELAYSPWFVMIRNDKGEPVKYTQTGNYYKLDGLIENFVVFSDFKVRSFTNKLPQTQKDLIVPIEVAPVIELAINSDKQAATLQATNMLETASIEPVSLAPQLDTSKTTIAVITPLEVKPTPTALEPLQLKMTKYSLNSSPLFAFDNASLSALSASTKTNLDKKVQEARDTLRHVDLLEVIGHTDRLGSNNLNIKLSEKRAAVVKDYITLELDKVGLAPTAVYSKGVGSTRPVKDCEGNKQTPELVACLAPNRRVEVAIKGGNPYAYEYKTGSASVLSFYTTN